MRAYNIFSSEKEKLEYEEKTMKLNKQRFIDLLKSTNRKGIDDVIKWLESTTFFEDPASAKYHGNYPGGLCVHSLNVYHNYISLISDTNDTAIIACLLHDVCKIGTYKKVYSSNPSDFSFTYANQSTLPFGHGDKSVLMLLQHGLELTEEEILMIRWHMGAYESKECWNDLGQAQSMYKSVMYIHFADMLASKYDD